MRSLLKFGTMIQLILLLLMNTVVKGLEVKSINASLENVYNFPISREQKHILVYETIGELFQKNHKYNALKVICSAQQIVEISCPLIITVTQKNSVVFWTIPAYEYPSSDSTERTICFDDESLEEMVTVELSTCSKTPIHYSLSVQLRNDLQIALNTVTRSQLTPSSPTVYYFPPLAKRQENRNNGQEFFFLQLTSTSNYCMVMSIQKPICPIGEMTLETMMHKGQWMTVSVKSAMTLPMEDFPSGFFIMFLLLPDDSWCNHVSLGQPEISKISSYTMETLPSQEIIARRKTIHFDISIGLPTAKYHVAIFIPLGLFLIFISTIFIIHLHFHRIRCNLIKCEPSSSTPTCASAGERFEALYISHQCSIRMGSTDSIFRSRIQISELINSHPERLMVQSKRYYMAGILVASFYCVPVFQLILSYHHRLRETGNLDLCYFNYMCSHMLGMFHDFNHIYSNIGYLICGLAFMIIVYLRQITVEQDWSTRRATNSPEIGVIEKTLASSGSNNSNMWLPQIIHYAVQKYRAPMDISKGVFVHHGLFYAMGFSLFMTGIMSGGYHVCPNHNNFQFDTAFMYTIAALGVVTIYQFRHPTYVSASMTFLVLALVAASTVVGLLWESYKFRLFFTVTHITFLLVILVYIHYVGYIRVNGVTVTEWKKMFEILRQKWTDDIKNWRLLRLQWDTWSSPHGENNSTVVLPGPCRLIFPILVVALNFGALTMIWTMMRTANFASQVLAVYVINCSVYSVYYCVMKMVHYECRSILWIQPAIYLVISILLWTWSLSYFGDVVTLWERSPAESRAKNVECVWLFWYDSHDVWHFLSAAALFSSLMTLLTMDDDLIEKPKSEIPVF
ncbi:SID1 transmembrane family member 1 isoform X1 [Folsomia candida]|uniref:SID1 transmembrane family member 1 isoform X1 n=1 Tax=Folsomia candida TaxID=158441 RepID=UPI0016050EB7|nr:SID1 transmembrane family member 1 isoform X1 [Folsomia candida]